MPPDVGSVSIEYLLFYTNVADVLLPVVPAKDPVKQTAPRATNQNTIFWQEKMERANAFLAGTSTGTLDGRA